MVRLGLVHDAATGPRDDDRHRIRRLQARRDGPPAPGARPQRIGRGIAPRPGRYTLRSLRAEVSHGFPPLQRTRYGGLLRGDRSELPLSMGLRGADRRAALHDYTFRRRRGLARDGRVLAGWVAMVSYNGNDLAEAVETSGT